MAGPQRPANWGTMTVKQREDWKANRKAQDAQNKPPAPAQPLNQPPAQQFGPNAQTEDDELDDFEEPTDEVTLTIKLPGQDVTSMTGREVVAAILNRLAGAFGAASGE